MEIVMVLVIAGILVAVAVPKYFDLQDDAVAKKCQYNRTVVLTELYKRHAVSKIDDSLRPPRRGLTRCCRNWKIAKTAVPARNCVTRKSTARELSERKPSN